MPAKRQPRAVREAMDRMLEDLCNATSAYRDSETHRTRLRYKIDNDAAHLRRPLGDQEREQCIADLKDLRLCKRGEKRRIELAARAYVLALDRQQS